MYQRKSGNRAAPETMIKSPVEFFAWPRKHGLLGKQHLDPLRQSQHTAVSSNSLGVWGTA